MKTALGFFAAGITLATLAGCGNTVEVNTGGAGGAGSSGTGKGSTTIATGSTTTGTGGACSGFADAQGSAPVTVRFRNNSNLPIYLPANCNAVAYSITATNSPNGPSYVYDESCLQTCSDLQTQPQLQCGACAPSSYLLEPGATRDVAWNATGLSNRTMPSSCWKQPSPNQTSCGQIVDAPPGSFLVTAMGYASCDGNCQCDAQGVCNGAATGAQAYPDAAKLNFPGDSLVEVVFGVCAFPCPL